MLLYSKVLTSRRNSLLRNALGPVPALWLAFPPMRGVTALACLSPPSSAAKPEPAFSPEKL